MEALLKEQEHLASSANLGKSVESIQEGIDLLVKAREAIQANGRSASVTLAKLQNPMKQALEAANNDLKEIYKGQGRYQKVLETKFKDKPFPTSDNDALSTQSDLINRAIAMHLLREGQFEVATTFRDEVQEHLQRSTPHDNKDIMADDMDPLQAEGLREAFTEMYHILGELRQRNLIPAIAWARKNSAKLELRGSNLEFELGQLQFVYLFTGGDRPRDSAAASQGRYQALSYARQQFGHLQSRYLKEIARLASAMAFESNLAESPYHAIFSNRDSWDLLASTFTREFCSLLGLSAESPLHIAATAGAISLPTLLKLQTIMKDKRAEWTTAQELPVEIPLPPSYQFHSIFVCPVSKEQTTDENPPMMMPCGHVVAQETLARMSKGSRFKCPYCPIESRPDDARKLVL